MALPRAGSDTANERYLVPEVTTAPTAASEEYGLMPGTPEPAATNVGTATLGVAGGYRSDQAGTPTILVKAMDMGRAPIGSSVTPVQLSMLGMAANLKYGQSGWASAYTRYITARASYERALGGEGPSSASSVPRFAIKRSDWDHNLNNIFTNDVGDDAEYMGVDPNFALWSGALISAQPTGGAAGVWETQGNQPIFVAEDGTLRLIILGITSADPVTVGLQVWWYDQSLHRDWQEYHVNPDMNALIVGGTDTQFYPTDIDACAWQDAVYIVLTGYVGLPPLGQFWLFRLSGVAGAATLEAITSADGTGAVTAGQSGWAPTWGASLIATRQGLMLARGLWDQGATGTYSVALARSSDGIHWDRASASVTLSTVSITSSKYIDDSASSLPAANPGDKLTLLGTTASDGTYIVAATGTAARIEVVPVGSTPVNQSAGTPITVTITAHALEFLSDYRSRTIDLGSGEMVTGMSFANASEGFAVTDQGRIFFTADGGTTWAEQDAPTRANRNKAQVAIPLRGVYCRAATVGAAINAFAYGDQHMILVTDDTGARWAVYWAAYVINGVKLPFDTDDWATNTLDGVTSAGSLGANYRSPFGDLRFNTAIWTSGTAGWIA